MVRQKPDLFLSGVSKVVNQKDSTLVIKRYYSVPEIKKKLRHVQKRQFWENIKANNNCKEVLVRFGSGDKKLATVTNPDLVKRFADQLCNIYRLNVFKTIQEKKKKQKVLPTPANPRSKTTQKLKEKKLKNQQRRKKRAELAKLKKRELQRQKTYALKKKNQERAA